MGQNGNTIRPQTTRRRILKSLAGVVGVSALGETVSAQSSQHFGGTITHQNQLDSQTNTEQNMRQNEAYLLLPGGSLTSLFINIPSLVKNSPGSTPTFIMDEYDYQRFRGRVITERGDTKMQAMGLIFDELRQRGHIRTIDYSKYYTSKKQGENIQRSQRAVHKMSDGDVQSAASQAAEGWTRYGLGGYQDGFRSDLDALESFEQRRKELEKQHRKIDRGTGNPEVWNKRVFSQYAAALEVRRRANQDLNLNINKIIGQGESQSIREVFRRSTDSSVEDELLYRTIEVDPEKTAQSREVLDKIHQISKDVTGVQHHDWFLLGPRLAVPQHDEIFRRLWSDMLYNDSLDVSELASETRDVLTILDEGAEDNTSIQQIQSEANWVEEEYDISPQRAREQMDKAFNLANHSRELRTLTKNGRFSPAAVFLAASIKMDPVRRYNQDSVYRRAVDLRRRYEPVTVSNSEIDGFRGRGGFRRGGTGKDWYQVAERAR